jgi:hypothetical protein
MSLRMQIEQLQAGKDVSDRQLLRLQAANQALRSFVINQKMQADKVLEETCYRSDEPIDVSTVTNRMPVKPRQRQATVKRTVEPSVTVSKKPEVAQLSKQGVALENGELVEEEIYSGFIKPVQTEKNATLQGNEPLLSLSFDQPDASVQKALTPPISPSIAKVQNNQTNDLKRKAPDSASPQTADYGSGTSVIRRKLDVGIEPFTLSLTSAKMKSCNYILTIDIENMIYDFSQTDHICVDAFLTSERINTQDKNSQIQTTQQFVSAFKNRIMALKSKPKPPFAAVKELKIGNTVRRLEFHPSFPHEETGACVLLLSLAGVFDVH